MKRKVFDKTEKRKKGFIPFPLDLLQYRHHPNFKKGAETLYMLIAHYYNTDKKCAYPSMTLLAADCASTESTIDKHIKSLEELELIRVVRRKKGNLYIPLEPLERKEFFEKYPNVQARYDNSYRKVEERRELKEQYLAAVKNVHNGEAVAADKDNANEPKW
ncbi:helix-turn-helix domain-containing protein [Alkalihalobacterium sp. APHAB7]|uniref:helix-turn-helix domain-containing protein n=1 Tax=Alkalihalobacterium sp. APHAB7 TaxID=3402081 RepID=UPI003AAD052A